MPAHGPMPCPIDQTPLVMSERQGIEIDYCPTCRGVWLDRGELDKIIQRANEATGTTDAGASAGGAAGSAARGSFTTPRVGNMQGRVEPRGTVWRVGECVEVVDGV